MGSRGGGVMPGQDRGKGPLGRGCGWRGLGVPRQTPETPTAPPEGPKRPLCVLIFAFSPSLCIPISALSPWPWASTLCFPSLCPSP